jgi:lipopolysaccharide transport system permease protein
VTKGAPSVRVIEPARQLELPRVSDVVRHRDLMYFLIHRDIVARYKQSVIGASWAIVQPLALAVVFSVFLGELTKIESGNPDVPYPVFALAGMVAWLLFGSGLSRVIESTVGNQGLIAKAFFPRIVLPVAAAAPAMVDFLVAFPVVLGAIAVFGVPLRPQMLLAPMVAPLIAGLSLGLGLWLSALYVRFRDVALGVPFLLLIGLFMTPIVYPFELVPEHLQTLYAVNPMVGLLELYRWLLFPGIGFPGWMLAWSLGVGVALVVGGAVYFQQAQRTFADVI